MTVRELRQILFTIKNQDRKITIEELEVIFAEHKEGFKFE